VRFYKHKFNRHNKSILAQRFLERCKPEDKPDEPGWHKLIPEEF